MKKKCRRGIVYLLLLTMLMVSPMELSAKQTTQEKLDQAEESRDDLKDTMDAAQSDIDDMNQEKSELESDLAELNSKLEEISNILNELEEAISEKKEEIDQTWGQIEELELQVNQTSEAADAQYQLSKAQIKYIYEQGDNVYIELLKSSENYADYINKSSYIDMISEYQKEQFEKLNEVQQDLSEKQTEYENALIKLEDEKGELDQYEKQVSEQQNRIETLIDETADKIAKYADQIDSAEAKMLIYEEELETRENDISVLKKTLEDEAKLTVKAEESKWTDISDVQSSTSDRKLLANIIFCEAGNQPYVGKVAVGAVVMNRVRSSVYPNTIVEVIYQKGQFTPASSGRLALALTQDQADEECYQAADAALSGVTNVGDCLYFRRPTSSVAAKYQIGDHIFY